jgi:hypothetical protein
VASPAVEATVASADDFEAVPTALATLSWRRHLRVERAVPTVRLTSHVPQPALIDVRTVLTRGPAVSPDAGRQDPPGPAPAVGYGSGPIRARRNLSSRWAGGSHLCCTRGACCHTSSQLRCSPPGITVRSASDRRGRRKSARPAPTGRSRATTWVANNLWMAGLRVIDSRPGGGRRCLGGRSASYGRRTTLRDTPGQTPGFGHMVLPNIWLP